MALTKIRAEQISDIDFKQAVRVVATTNVTLTNGAVDTIDGVLLAVSNRVLVTGQSTASQNGLYRVSVLGTGADGTWVRSSDGDATGDMSAGMLVTVTEGTVYADTQWQLTTNNPIVLGTTSLVFAQSSPADSYTAGTGLTLTALVFSVNAAQTQITSVGTLTALSVSGTVTGASVVGGVMTGTSVSVTGNITTTANVTGGYILGNGSQLTGVISSYGNSNVAAYLPTYTGNLVALTGNIITTANVTSGNLLTGGLISATGTITGGNLATAGAITGASSSVSGIVTGASVVGGVITGSSASVTGIVTGASVVGGVITGSSASVTGNITGGNVLGGANVNATTHTGTTVSVTGNVNGGNILTSGLISATGNVTGGNIITGGVVSVTGNVTSGASVNTVNLSVSGNVLGNLLPSANITYNLGSTTQRWNTLFLAGNTIDLGSQTISSSADGVSMGTGNLSGGNILTSGSISATGNVTADDIYANSYTVGTSYNISAYSATTASSAAEQEIYSIAPGEISSIDFKIIAYCNTGETHTKTTTFITTTILSSTLVWAEYGRLNINSGVGTLSVAYISGGGVSPMIKLLATPSSSNLTYYNLIISIYN